MTRRYQVVPVDGSFFVVDAQRLEVVAKCPTDKDARGLALLRAVQDLQDSGGVA